jgi:hypothetical protein
MHLIKSLIFVVTYFYYSTGFAQSFNYNHVYSQAQYAALVDSTSQLIDNFWSSNSIDMPIGFEMNVAGESFDSLVLRSNGVISFGSDQRINFVFLMKDFFQKENINPSSKVLCKHISDAIHPELIIEFRDIAFTDLSNNVISLSFQIVLKKENNVIEMRMGHSDISSSDPIILGLINMANTVDHPLGYLLSNNSSNPLSHNISAGGSPVFMSNIPTANSIYSFSLNAN